MLHSAYGSGDRPTNCTSVCVFTYGQGHVWVYMQLCIEAKGQFWCYFPWIVHFVFETKSLNGTGGRGWLVSEFQGSSCLSLQCWNWKPMPVYAAFYSLLGLALKASCLCHKNFTNWANSIANKWRLKCHLYVLLKVSKTDKYYQEISLLIHGRKEVDKYVILDY